MIIAFIVLVVCSFIFGDWIGYCQAYSKFEKELDQLKSESDERKKHYQEFLCEITLMRKYLQRLGDYLHEK